MNQRQKKKGSQAKKRYHEAVRKQEPHKKVTSQPQKSKESNHPVENVTSHSDTKAPSKKNEIRAQSGSSVKSYSKRKIVSNWSRYQEGR